MADDPTNLAVPADVVLSPGESVLMLAIQQMDRRLMSHVDASLERNQEVTARLDKIDERQAHVDERLSILETGTPTTPPAARVAASADARASKVELEQAAFQARVLTELSAVKDAQAKADGSKVWGVRVGQIVLLIAGAVAWLAEHVPAKQLPSPAPAPAPSVAP